MKLLTLNIKSEPFLNYVNSMTDGRGDEVLFIDWIPAISAAAAKQIEIIETTPSTVQVIVFDRYSAMSQEEVDFFVNRGAILLEPVLRPRPEFTFIPYYIDKLDLPLSTWEEKRPFSFGYKGKKLTLGSEKHILKAIKSIPDIKIGVSVKRRLRPKKFDSLKGIMDFGNFGWDKFDTTLIVGNDSDYDKGVLPDITNHLKYGVVPFVDHNYKWFHALFKNFMIFDICDIVWYKGVYKYLHYGLMDEIYKNIESVLPEMMTENFVSTIVSLGAGK